MSVGLNSMEKDKKDKKEWIVKLMEEKETLEAINFLHGLNRKDFLFYVQLIRDSHRHRLETDGNCASEIYVQRTASDLVRERDFLKAELEKERKMNRDLVANQDTSKDTLQILSDIKSDMALKKSAAKQPTVAGQIGEDWVEEALREAFPSPAKVSSLKGQSGCGDLTFAIDGKRIMFEVKNYASGTIKGQRNGEEINKFFSDVQQTQLGYRYDAAVLVSLNTLVDKDAPSLYPLVHKDSNIPYMFIDNAKQFPDTVSLFRVVVNFMLVMIKHTENGKDPNAMSEALKQAKEMELLYQQMRSAYNDQKKPLDQMKDKVHQLLEVLGESKQPQKRPGNAAIKSHEPKINKRQNKNP